MNQITIITRLRSCSFFSLLVGDEFDPREFHNVILNLGPSPLEMVESKVMNWVAEKGVVSSSNYASVTISAILICLFVMSSYLVVSCIYSKTLELR